MSSVTRIICLANSRKYKERCIAGINPKTGQWIRPISRNNPNNGGVPESVRLIEGNEPALLELLEIPLENEGADFGFALENQWIVPGVWRKVGKVKPSDVIRYCINYPYILHNPYKYVSVPFIQKMPKQERRTLQLVYARKLLLKAESNTKGGITWKGTIKTANGQYLSDIPITDPELEKKLTSGSQPQDACLVTVSLGLPHKPHDRWEGDDPCWKLIARVIELTEADQILAEMQRLNWSIDRGREYLWRNFKVRSRSELSSTELTSFLNYLKSLPQP
ncbi:hypothetical protein NIES593_07460 [Hydrococcus rivularis NIES-593]|uniref:Dual OB-containing domain-containing protein n=1 Tax=Hydrococcus rivularis NIES-593 TaxID=1921803 RepID=A0A1U7HLR9_9CYAN|nr:hypothetical protein [Hydrococcus rivularis]OKH24504.1 hypothetical protein NIES593_07460 [Hydrococcus rivularis NIES-593]